MAHPPAVVLVEGEAGIGKTSLVRTAVGRAGGSGRRLLLGHCHPLREPFPYGPVIEALRDLAGALPPAERLNPVTGALRGHLPELADALPPVPAPLTDLGMDRHRLFRAVHGLLTAAGPAVLVVEDLHWADDGTQDLLRFLTRRPPEELAMVLTYRRQDLQSPGPPLGAGYRHLVIPLAPLDAGDVGRMASALLGRAGLGRAGLPASFPARLHERTSGIPFLVEEVVRSIGEDRQPEALERAGVPLQLREAMAEQLARLSPPRSPRSGPPPSCGCRWPSRRWPPSRAARAAWSKPSVTASCTNTPTAGTASATPSRRRPSTTPSPAPTGAWPTSGPSASWPPPTRRRWCS
ncbi:AAA family ATPase [Nonomuraea sp. NBC_01738]|uniref:ATP-binding protein n=1 Tax=Nonomuraea sp. NBC_01738 TaxID=2976003 RepID=UPI002E0E601E|nr:AAA family ATPase [Nonomuraea sp. NBC_01738]